MKIDRHLKSTSMRFAELLNDGLPYSPAPWEKSFSLVSDWAATHGVSRVAETTNLDRVGIPTAYAIRPSAANCNAIVSGGRGTTRKEALLSALFEAHERWAAEASALPPILASQEDLQCHFPRAMTVTRSCLPTVRAAWLIGYDLVSQKSCFVPAEVAVFPYHGERRLFLESNTSGLASGATPAAAICSAILELFERDAVARFSFRTNSRIDPTFLPRQAAELYDRFRSVQVDLSLWYCASPVKIPVFYCLSRDDRMGSSVFFCSGSAGHFDVELAIVRTLTEMAQSRAAFITALREDVAKRVTRFAEHSYEARRVELSKWFDWKFQSPDLSQLYSIPPSAWQLKTLVNLFSSMYPDGALACVELKRYPGLFAFRVYSPVLYEPDTA